MAAGDGKKYAYATLVTRASYLAGVILLAHSLKKHGSVYPLIVYYTPTLSRNAVRALELESSCSNLILRPCDLLLPPERTKVHLIAERFTDTWTKLRVFDVFEYDAVCYVDADMMILKNMDSVFSNVDSLPYDCIAANHACVCNLDKDPWAPEDWTKESCAYTPLSHPEALIHPTPVASDSRPTYHLLNSGMFVYHPHKELWDRMLHFFNNTDKLSTYKFPDQDFLADFFRGKWRSIGWQYNALKTMRYWHGNIWRDDEVVCLHYIVDKPWASRVGDDGVAGYKGRDGVTHQWWWDEYKGWMQQRQAAGHHEVLDIVKDHVAKEDGTENSDPDMKAIGSKVQAFAHNKVPSDAQPDGTEESVPKPGGPALRKPMLGEQGHGPMARPNAHGSSMMPP